MKPCWHSDAEPKNVWPISATVSIKLVTNSVGAKCFYVDIAHVAIMDIAWDVEP